LFNRKQILNKKLPFTYDVEIASPIVEKSRAHIGTHRVPTIVDFYSLREDIEDPHAQEQITTAVVYAARMDVEGIVPLKRV
jgi:hypothetical protein